MSIIKGNCESSMHVLVIGANLTIGEMAFEGNGCLWLKNYILFPGIGGGGLYYVNNNSSHAGMTPGSLLTVHR